LLSALALTDPRELPPDGVRRSGPPELTEGSPSSWTFEQRLSDGAVLVMRLSHIGNGEWRVVSVLPGPESVVS